MALTDYYLPLRQAHVTAVTSSLTLFALRGAAVLAGRGWAMRRPWRVASVAIDTVLLAAGVALWTLLALNPVRDVWLAAKMALLVAYVVLGSCALKRARTRRGKALAFAAAAACAAAMVTIALAHHPAGLLRHLAAS